MTSSWIFLSAFLILSVIYISTKAEAAVLPSSENEEKTSPVEIRVISRKKRSIGSGTGGFDLELNVFDQTHKLKLRSPSHNLFTDSFAYHELSVDRDGSVVNTKKQIHKRDLQAIEQNIFVDPAAQAVLNVEDVDGNLHLDGLVRGMRIRRDATGNHSAGYTVQQARSFSDNDYVKDDRQVATGRGFGGGPSSVTVEHCIVYDHTNSKNFNFDENQIIPYMGLIENIINNLFTSIKGATVVFKLAGVFVIKDTKAQPFVESIKKGGKIDANALFDEFKKWASANLDTLPKHDVLSLLYGDDQSTNTMGVGTLGGACNIDPSKKKTHAVSVAYDTKKTLRGGQVLVHELAHNLGVNHDGDTTNSDAAKCPASLGHIMGQPQSMDDLATHITFSTCSSEQLKTFIQSPSAACLNKIDNPKHHPQVGKLGPSPTKNEQCEYLMGKGAIAAPSPEEEKEQMLKKMMEKMGIKPGDGTKLEIHGGPPPQKNQNDPNAECKMLMCQNEQTMVRIPFIPVENSPCGKSGGKCKNGACVAAG